MRAKPLTRDGYTAAQLQWYAINQIHAAGGLAWRNNSGALRTDKRFVRFGKVGSGDVIGILPPNGRFISIEIKTERDRPTEAQIEFVEAVRALGGIAIIARSIADIDEVLIPFM